MLLEFLKHKPLQKYISSPNKDFPSGCGMIMSKDIADLWANNYNSHFKNVYLDDVAFGHVLINNNILISNGFRYDIYNKFYENLLSNQEYYMNNKEDLVNMINSIVNNIPENMFHIRLKLINDYFRTNYEPTFLKYLIQKHYLISE